jgi:hypothetical protein
VAVNIDHCNFRIAQALRATLAFGAEKFFAAPGCGNVASEAYSYRFHLAKVFMVVEYRRRLI